MPVSVSSGGDVGKLDITVTSSLLSTQPAVPGGVFFLLPNPARRASGDELSDTGKVYFIGIAGRCGMRAEGADQGATFYFSLPKAQEAAEKSASTL